MPNSSVMGVEMKDIVTTVHLGRERENSRYGVTRVSHVQWSAYITVRVSEDRMQVYDLIRIRFAGLQQFTRGA